MSITIYSTINCAACDSLTHWLDKNKVAYDKKFVDEDAAAMAEFLDQSDGMIGVPFTVIHTDDTLVTKISGFNLSEFKRALALA